MSSTQGQVIKCKAAVSWEASKPLVIEEVEVAPPQKMEVRLKILFTSLCHTDVYFWEAKGQTPLFPRIFGHEAGGIVESVGEGVTELQPGDHVLPVFTGECKECRHSSTPLSMLAVLPRLIQQPHWIKFVFSAVGYLQAAEGARIAGASRIIGIDLNPNRFEEAKKFGVTEFVSPKDHDKPVQEVLAEMTDGGVDRSIECTGNVNAMISAFECVHDGWGVAVLVGVPNKDDAFKTHPVNVLNERTLKGTFFGNYKPRSDIPGVVEKYMNKELEVEKFVTHRVGFSEINKAFDYMMKGESLRCIISMDS
ncbi:Alcohol dehydrogenase 1 [Sesamum angolense]|uniref:Alcohol dehydrogenase 1 n=1 Tax=Sesamum angolense TaxID=2727404 RepID=A0AAE1W674_9LAMI|nr:Alcohol dehydrogenase 1 [Sesamum angolense]